MTDTLNIRDLTLDFKGHSGTARGPAWHFAADRPGRARGAGGRKRLGQVGDGAHRAGPPAGAARGAGRRNGRVRRTRPCQPDPAPARRHARHGHVDDLSGPDLVAQSGLPDRHPVHRSAAPRASPAFPSAMRRCGPRPCSTMSRSAIRARVLGSYPFQLSGGMNQRVMIAMALANEPALLIADEPGTALDVTVQAQTLGLMRDLVAAHQTSVLFISHNLGVVREFADRIYVIYKGRIVESGTDPGRLRCAGPRLYPRPDGRRATPDRRRHSRDRRRERRFPCPRSPACRGRAMTLSEPQKCDQAVLDPGGRCAGCR